MLVRSASDMLDELNSDSHELLRRRLKNYFRPSLLCIDEIGYLSYDENAADLLFHVVNPRYEARRSIVLTTNLAFKDWNSVFPNATCIATLLDRLTHHADVTLLEGKSYRVRESEQENAERKEKTPNQNPAQISRILLLHSTFVLFSRFTKNCPTRRDGLVPMTASSSPDSRDKNTPCFVFKPPCFSVPPDASSALMRPPPSCLSAPFDSFFPLSTSSNTLISTIATSTTWLTNYLTSSESSSP